MNNAANNEIVFHLVLVFLYSKVCCACDGLRISFAWAISFFIAGPVWAGKKNFRTSARLGRFCGRQFYMSMPLRWIDFEFVARDAVYISICEVRRTENHG